LLIEEQKVFSLDLASVLLATKRTANIHRSGRSYREHAKPFAFEFRAKIAFGSGLDRSGHDFAGRRTQPASVLSHWIEPSSRSNFAADLCAWGCLKPSKS
jgi:hypothetical protein